LPASTTFNHIIFVVGKLVHILKQSFSMFFERKVMYKEIKTNLMQRVLDKKNLLKAV